MGAGGGKVQSVAKVPFILLSTEPRIYLIVAVSCLVYMDPRKVSYNFNLNKSFYLLLCKIIAIAQSYQLYLISALKSFWNFEKYDVIYLDFLSASAMSHFTPDKMEALVSRPLSPPNSPGSGKKIVWWDLWVPDLERWALNTGAVHQPELCLGDWGPSSPSDAYIWEWVVQINCATMLLRSPFYDEV